MAQIKTPTEVLFRELAASLLELRERYDLEDALSDSDRFVLKLAADELSGLAEDVEQATSPAPGLRALEQGRAPE